MQEPNRLCSPASTNLVDDVAGKGPRSRAVETAHVPLAVVQLEERKSFRTAKGKPMCLKSFRFFSIILIPLILTGCSKRGIKGRYWYFVDNIATEEGEPAQVRLWVALPIEHRGQGVNIGAIYPEPMEIIQDSINGNQIVFWQIDQPADGEQLHFYYDFEVFPEEVNTDIDPTRIESYQKEAPEYIRYTKSEPWIEIIPEIEETAAEIVRDETNPYFQARKIFHWVMDNMSYEYPDTSQRGVAKSFPKRKGDCGEYAWAFCALCRSVGIPARAITCRWIQIEGGHAWAEFWLPPYGWIPVDPSIADGLIEGAGGASREDFSRWLRDVQKIQPTDPDYFFGNLYPNRLILFIGNNVPVTSLTTGIERTFKAMQPGGNSALPPGIEFNGLANRAVHGGLFIFGADRSDLARAREKAEKELAFSYFRAGLYDQAERGFLKKLAEEPEDAASLWGLGMVYTMKKDYDAAIDAFHRSIAGDGGSSKPAIEALARYKLGNCYDVKGMRDLAVREYQTVVRMDVNFYGAVDSSKKYLQKPYVESK